MKRVSLECGGKSPYIIMADCPDLDQACESAAMGIFYNQGQVCTATSRLLVHHSLHDQVVEKIKKIGQSLIVGDPLNPATQLGAIVDQKQLDRVCAYIQSGHDQQARLAYGGQRINANSGGYFINPTIFTHVTPQMTIAREEIFGPVLSVMTFDTPEQAVAIANDTDYGLAACIWSKDINTAHWAAKQLRSGMVWVNCHDADDMTVPFGGYKQSGFGRDKSLHALEKYTELKTTWLQISH